MRRHLQKYETAVYQIYVHNMAISYMVFKSNWLRWGGGGKRGGYEDLHDSIIPGV